MGGGNGEVRRGWRSGGGEERVEDARVESAGNEPSREKKLTKSKCSCAGPLTGMLDIGL